ncbi:MAG: TIGR01777 family oxidoreductase [Acidimicrobiales bacterium]|jgi:uncharacterized protein (TIGR01777 family)
MTILVTGTSGLIGSALVTTLTEHGHRAVRLVRPGAGSPPPAATDGGRPETVDWDPSRGTVNVAGLEAAGPFDGVVHLAGAGVADRRWSPARKALILRSRTDSTELLVTTLVQLAQRPPVLVSASAIGIYGERGNEELTEQSPRGSGFLADVAAAWEESTLPATDAGVRVVNIRTGLVLAAGGGVLGKQLPLFKVGLGGKLGPGTQYQSWIALDDEVAVILRALTDGRLTGPVNAVTPNPVTNAEFTSTLGRLLHRPTLCSVPAAALRLALGHQMAEETVLVSQRVVPEVLVTSGFSFAHADLGDALASVVGAGRA